MKWPKMLKILEAGNILLNACKRGHKKKIEKGNDL